LTLAS